MDNWLIGLGRQVFRAVFQLSTSCIVLPIAKLYLWYLIYSAGILALKIALKLRYEIFNQDLKYARRECLSKVVVVTGATSGIGLAVSKHLLSRGFTVIACYYNKNEPGYQQLESKQLELGAHSRLFLIALDVRSADSIERCNKSVVSILEADKTLKFHALINVAGLGSVRKFHWQPKEEIRAILETNLMGPVMMTREFMPLLIKNSAHSRVINVSSPLAKLSIEYGTVYGATKAGLAHFSNVLTVENAKSGLKTVTIYPGNVIRNTAIIQASITTSHESLLEALSDEERKMYDGELVDQQKLMSKFNRLRDRPINLSINLRDRLSKNLAKILIILTGGISGRNLEETHLMNSFDNAVRLRNPSGEIYAGNPLYEILIGSLLEMVSAAFLRDLSYKLVRLNFSLSQSI